MVEETVRRDDEGPVAAMEPALTKVTQLRPPDAVSTCLRPLGLCELGGCCDACWYRPDHPRFRQR